MGRGSFSKIPKTYRQGGGLVNQKVMKSDGGPQSKNQKVMQAAPLHLGLAVPQISRVNVGYHITHF